MEIWGVGTLGKVQKADAEKNGLLLLYKVNVIRIKQLRRNLSDKNLRDTAWALHHKINEIVTKGGQANVHTIEVS
mgnify:FL=1